MEIAVEVNYSITELHQWYFNFLWVNSTLDLNHVYEIIENSISELRFMCNR